MNRQNFNMMSFVAFTCGVWYVAGYLAGYYNTCERAYDDGKLVGKEEGVLEASAPTDQ